MSTTKNLGLFKHDNPATNTDQFNVEKALNQNWDKVDKEAGNVRTRLTTLETDNTTNKQDISNIKAEQEVQNNNIELNKTNMQKYVSELEAENIRLREDLNGLPKATVSGESIDLSDSAEMRCELKISGNSRQETREGYNLLQTIGKEVLLDQGLTIKTATDGKVIINGTPTYNYSGILVDQDITAILEDGKSYTLWQTKAYSYCYLQIRAVKTDGSGNVYYTLSSNNIANFIVDKTKYSKYIIGVTTGPDATSHTFNNLELYFMLVKGSYTAEILPEYEPYGASPSPDYPSEVKSCGDNGSINEVICNKNLLNIYKQMNVGDAITVNGVTITIKEEGKIILNGTSTADSFIPINKSVTLEPGTYTESANNNNTIGSAEYSKPYCSIRLIKNNGTDIIDNNKCILANKNATNTFVINEKHMNVWFQIRIGEGITFNNFEIQPQIEKNTIATEFVEHKEQTYTIPTQQPFRVIRDIRDTFIKKDNKWYERHYDARKIFDGTENFNLRSQTEKFAVFEINMIDKVFGFDNILCSHFKVSKSISIDSATEECIRGSSGSGYIYIKVLKERLSSPNISGFKAYLTSQYNAGTPVYIDYTLVEPQDIECTSEQSAILDKIENEAKTYKNITHTYSTDEVSPNIEATYKKDIETLFANTLVESGV